MTSRNQKSHSSPQSHERKRHPQPTMHPATQDKHTMLPTCVWDKQNLSTFQSLRSQMINALLATANKSSGDDSSARNSNVNSYARSQSTSAAIIADSSKKELIRSKSIMPHHLTAEGVSQSFYDLLPTDENYFSKAAHHLFDTPLPFRLHQSPTSEPIHLRKPHKHETTHLLSRIYLRTWFEWARSSIINSRIRQYHQWQSSRDESGMNDTRSLRLGTDSIRTLAALSIISEQFSLWKGDDPWNVWMATLEDKWRKYSERRLSCPDEKKDEEMYEMEFLPVKTPGAVDSRLLSSYGHALLLRRNVSLMMGGVQNEDDNVLGVDDEIREDQLLQFLARDKQASSDNDDKPRLVVCPVSASFYECIRSTLGVICEDGTCISFQPGKAPTGHGEILYHEQYSNLTTGNKSSKDIDIPHPSCASQSTSMEAVSSPVKRQIPRPIEFQRRILTVPAIRKQTDISSTPTNSSTPNKKMSSYSKLMKEAMTSRKEEGKDISTEESTTCTVEVHPVELRYVVSDATLPGPNSMNKDSKAYSAHGVALVSRVADLSEVLNDLKRVVECNRSSACVRLWSKSPCVGTSVIRGATARGDGYDLIDAALLDAKEDGPTVEKGLRLEGSVRDASSGPDVVEILVETRSSPTSRWAREPLELENRLQVGDYVDAQDTALKWYEAIVRELTPETVKVHYFGWGSRWDGELPRRKGSSKKVSPPMPLWSKTSRWRERIRVGQEVEVRQTASLAYRPKWYRATVIAIRRESDNNPIEIVGGAELEMIGEDKKSPLKMLQRKRQILVMVPQEKNNCSSPVPSQLRQDNGMPVVHPPYIRWVDLYGEEICEANTHINFKKQSDAPATVTYAIDSERKQPVEVMKSFNNLHGAGFVRESLRGVPPAPGSVGLHNLGNSCYMNSILQCINHISPITQYFLKGEYVKHVNRKNPLGSGGRVATAYASFLSEIWTGEYSILAPRTLKQTVGFFAPQFNNNYQHDSQEFCQYLMDGLHEDLNKVIEKPYVEHMEANGMKDEEAALESWKRHLLRHDSIFVDYTQGMHRSHLTCPSCGKESIKFDVYSSISLPLVPSKDRPSIPLKDCLDQFAAGEQLDEHNAWYCSRCKKHVCALKLITLWNTPDILVLHLKRFTFEKCPTHDGRLLRRKIEDKVDFPIDRLDLTSYILGPKHEDAPPIYKLFGVSEHTGSTANSGHYTATVRNSKDGNWYRYNDSHVGSTSGDAAVTGGAYLLFYQREKGSLRWAGMERHMQIGGRDADGFTQVRGKKKKP